MPERKISTRRSFRWSRVTREQNRRIAAEKQPSISWLGKVLGAAFVLVLAPVIAAWISSSGPEVVHHVRGRLAEPVPSVSIQAHLNWSNASYTSVFPDPMAPDVRTEMIALSAHLYDDVKDVDDYSILDPVLRRGGGVRMEYGTTPVKLVFQSLGKDVVITDIRAHVLSHAPAISGTAFDYAAAGQSPTVKAALDLDSPDLSLRRTTSDGAASPQRYFDSHFLSLKPNESLVLNINASTDTSYVTWYFEVDETSGGQANTVRVLNHGKPFESTAFLANYQSFYEFDIDGKVPEFRKCLARDQVDC